MNLKFKIFIVSLLVITSISAQKKLTYNAKGELSKETYQQLTKSKKYEAISAFDTVSLKPLLIYAIYIKDKKLGILNDSGIEITPAMYDGIEGLNISYTTVMFGFHEFYPVKVGKKYGLITNQGKQILPLEYDYIRPEAKRSSKRNHKKEVVQDSIIIAEKGNEELHFTTKGKLIAKETNARPVVTERQNQYDEDRPYRSTAQTTAAETTPFGTVIKKLANGFAIVQNKVENKYYYQGLVNLATGKLVLPVIYNYIIESQKGKIIAVKDKKYTLFNDEGEQILPDTYDGIDNFNTIYRIKKDGKTALFDLDINQKTDFIYDSFGSASKDFMITTIGKNTGVIDLSGKEIIPFEYDKIEAYFNRNGASGLAFLKVIKDNKQGLINNDGTSLTEMIYESIIPECTIERPSFSSEMTMPIDHDYDAKNNFYFIVKKDNLYGLLDRDFKPLIDTKYEKIEKGFHKDFIVVGRKNKTRNSFDLSLLNIKTQTTILPYEYNYFQYLGGTYFMIHKGLTMGVCDFNGTLIIPMDNCDNLSDRYYYDVIYKGLQVISGRGRNFLIDYQGTMIDRQKQ